MPLPVIPSIPSGFISCSSNILIIEQLLAILGGNRNFINSGIDQIRANIDNLVTTGGLGTTSEVLQGASNLQAKKKAIIPDYTKKDNNTGDALDQYENDLYAFQSMIRKCPSSHVKSMLALLGLGTLFPNVDDIEMARTGYSTVRQAIKKINAFPLAYLRHERDNILKNAYRLISGVTDNVADFAVGNTLDALESKMPSMITQIARDLEMLLICVEKIACSSVAPLKLRYTATMQSMPLNPAFDINLTDKLRPVPDYKLNSQTVYSGTTATPQQQSNLGVARNSVTDVMNYARGQTDKYFTVK